MRPHQLHLQIDFHFDTHVRQIKRYVLCIFFSVLFCFSSSTLRRPKHIHTHTVSIDSNLFCFMPFYGMYIFLMALHIKFAQSAHRIGQRYRTLNEALKQSLTHGKHTANFAFFFSFYFYYSLAVFFSLALLPLTLLLLVLFVRHMNQRLIFFQSFFFLLISYCNRFHCIALSIDAKHWHSIQTKFYCSNKSR